MGPTNEYYVDLIYVPKWWFELLCTEQYPFKITILKGKSLLFHKNQNVSRVLEYPDMEWELYVHENMWHIWQSVIDWWLW